MLWLTKFFTPLPGAGSRSITLLSNTDTEPRVKKTERKQMKKNKLDKADKALIEYQIYATSEFEKIINAGWDDKKFPMDMPPEFVLVHCLQRAVSNNPRLCEEAKEKWFNCFDNSFMKKTIEVNQRESSGYTKEQVKSVLN